MRKALGEGLYEFRVRHTAREIAGMFGGYDKGKDPSERRQQREIATARERLDGFKTRQTAERRARRKH